MSQEDQVSPEQVSDERDAEQRYRFATLTRSASLAKLALIGAVIACILAAFAYVAGWLTPQRLTQARMVDRFEHIDGVYPGFRRNHAKGVCVSGFLDSNGAGARWSKAAVFRPGRVPVIGRFALAGGQPFVSDGPKDVRSLALSFRPTDHEEWRTGMIDIPIFVVKDAEGFFEQLRANAPDPATGKPDPEKMKQFLAHHPETVAALKIVSAKPFSSGFANASYNALHAFRFINAEGVSTPVRWSMVAVEPFEPEPSDQSAPRDKNYLFDALIAKIEQAPLQWHFIITIGQKDDPTNDATLAWPADREQVDVGTLTIDRIHTETASTCRDINFDPLVLPDGIEASDDPLLSARSAVYSVSYTRRAGETKSPSAVQVPNSDKGG